MKRKRSRGFGLTAPSVRAAMLKLLEQNPDCAAMRDLRHYLISEFFAAGTQLVFFNKWTKILYPISVKEDSSSRLTWKEYKSMTFTFQVIVDRELNLLGHLLIKRIIVIIYKDHVFRSEMKVLF
ncbi:hypothetical protein ACFE04_010074 [Oxalis oulophora]